MTNPKGAVGGAQKGLYVSCAALHVDARGNRVQCPDGKPPREPVVLLCPKCGNDMKPGRTPPCDTCDCPKPQLAPQMCGQCGQAISAAACGPTHAAAARGAGLDAP